MKSLFLFIVLSLYTAVTNAQYVTVTTQYVEPSFVDSKYFHPITIYTKADTIIKAYGKVDFNKTGIIYVHQKNTPIITREDWSYYNGKHIKKVDFKILDKTYTVYPINRKGDFGKTVLLAKVYENNTFKVYNFLKNYYESYNYGNFSIIKADEEKAYNLMVDFSDTTKPMPNRVNKLFKDCKDLKNKIKNKEFKKTYNEFIRALDFYDTNCN